MSNLPATAAVVPPPRIQNTKPLPNIPLPRSIQQSNSHRPRLFNRPGQSSSSQRIPHRSSDGGATYHLHTRASVSGRYASERRPSLIRKSLSKARPTSLKSKHPTKPTQRRRQHRNSALSTPLFTPANQRSTLQSTHPSTFQPRSHRSGPRRSHHRKKDNTTTNAGVSDDNEKHRTRKKKFKRKKKRSKPALTAAQLESLWPQLWSSRLRHLEAEARLTQHQNLHPNPNYPTLSPHPAPPFSSPQEEDAYYYHLHPFSSLTNPPLPPIPKPDPFLEAPVARELMAFFGSPKFGDGRAGALLTPGAVEGLAVVRRGCGRDSEWFAGIVEGARFGGVGTEGMGWAEGVLAELRGKEQMEEDGGRKGEGGLWRGMEYVSRDVGVVWVGNGERVRRGKVVEESESESDESSEGEADEQEDGEDDEKMEVEEEPVWTVGESDLEDDWEDHLSELESECGDRGGDEMDMD